MLLDDLRSIKLPKKRREFVNWAIDCLKTNGSLSVDTQMHLRRLERLYRVQFSELHASRERAKRTLWKMREGKTEEQARRLVDLREEEELLKKEDLGI
jgi:hypothetical protein